MGYLMAELCPSPTSLSVTPLLHPSRPGGFYEVVGELGVTLVSMWCFIIPVRPKSSKVQTAVPAPAGWVCPPIGLPCPTGCVAVLLRHQGLSSVLWLLLQWDRPLWDSDLFISGVEQSNGNTNGLWFDNSTGHHLQHQAYSLINGLWSHFRWYIYAYLTNRVNLVHLNSWLWSSTASAPLST